MVLKKIKIKKKKQVTTDNPMDKIKTRFEFVCNEYFSRDILNLNIKQIALDFFYKGTKEKNL